MHSLIKYACTMAFAFCPLAIHSASESAKLSDHETAYATLMNNNFTTIRTWQQCIRDLPKAITKNTINMATIATQFTALHMRAHFSMREPQMPTIANLLDLGANINAKGLQGNTPLHIAACNNDAEVVRALLAGKSDLTIENNEGKTALRLAQASCKPLSSFARDAQGIIIGDPIVFVLQEAMAAQLSTSKDQLDKKSDT